ncbi:hypothetical protein MACJ_002359 [Theileria orientalis]|uniref:Uncharacterized protein n=1 Tax=Theileria orientalis TaxID=68886 RepID=A0A976M618_THEOR|nr:hypothetical protein MACJ_002359 [Theileria orientalis]
MSKASMLQSEPGSELESEIEFTHFESKDCDKQIIKFVVGQIEESVIEAFPTLGKIKTEIPFGIDDAKPQPFIKRQKLENLGNVVGGIENPEWFTRSSIRTRALGNIYPYRAKFLTIF